MNYRTKSFLIDLAVNSAWILGFIGYAVLVTYVAMFNVFAGLVLLGVSLAAVVAVIDNFV